MSTTLDEAKKAFGVSAEEVKYRAAFALSAFKANLDLPGVEEAREHIPTRSPSLKKYDPAVLPTVIRPKVDEFVSLLVGAGVTDFELDITVAANPDPDNYVHCRLDILFGLEDTLWSFNRAYLALWKTPSEVINKYELED